MQRLGGLLHVLSDEDTYNLILTQMIDIAEKHDLYDLYDQQYISYDELFANYNMPIQLI